MIEVKSIRKKYGRKAVLKDVSFTAEKGQITCLIGINGVGKSTVLKAIMGLTPVTDGTILIDGKPLSSRVYEHITFIPDAISMPPGMTVDGCIQFMKDYYVSWNPKRAAELAGFFKLSGSDRVGELSKGNAAKLNLLLGLALDVDYVLMDEPFSGIDMFSREQIASVFTSHLIEDRGVIITTHEINDIEHLIDKVILLENGLVRREFDTETVRQEEGKSVMDVMREVYNG
ncbi:ABC transporter ATP-binding protein [Paenibacillus sacheonensis]|uniref:ATP-binding cassette domain-containing protein n=1 Tax=Paenibacillus sacheonensis TaxID=742054 RepID=A0A7X4YTD2_9BACL|nr:ABC transporter ATP-binding protein [Paenibacillus sacheonensis]MBM7565720.1 ABC-2 type transport system ATP-binding protein [Paenibacillus sacheonensis]NBC72222.1 ATP-binding cassette domain-containing protein [Paenibacillus sacheonensis]